ncbi:MAG: sulfatase [Proteiniphilum sp.]
MNKINIIGLICPVLLINNHIKAEKISSKLPNFLIVYVDDMGYGDLGCFGSTLHRTPNLDKMAEEGIKFTDFYVTSGVSSPSRASLLTGCYPQRIGLQANAKPIGSVGRQVLFPVDSKGLNPKETTIGKILKSKGYSTACIGKWHLGDQNAFLPTQHGFDYYFGIPYSNDMNRDFCPLPLMKNNKVIEAPVDQNTITKRYKEETIKFIKENKNCPFFIYLAHSMPHNPLHASNQFRGKSNNGIYGDAVEEIDWSVGEIFKVLKEEKLDDNTVVIFASDNGADRRYGGSNAPLSGWKGSTMEGGMRVPCIMRWPSVIQRGRVCHDIVTTLEILPTIAEIVSFDLRKEPRIDGKSVLSFLTGETIKSPRSVFNYYQLEQLQAIRWKEWKLHLALDSALSNIHNGTFGPGRKMKLINLKEDIKEEIDLSENRPDIVIKIMKYANEARKSLGDLGIEGSEVRKAGIVDKPEPQLLYQDKKHN